MTVETKLRSAMADTVSRAHPDVDLLVATARRRGLGIRRRRQALGTVGVAAALALAVSAPSFVAGDRGSAPDSGVLVGTQPHSLGDGPLDPLTGRSTAAALLYAVGLQASGTATDIRGSGDHHMYPESYVIFRFTPEGSSTFGEVAVNVNSGLTYGNTKPGDDSRQQMGRCQAFMRACTSARLPDGSRLTTYEDPSSYGDRRGVRRVAELYRPDVDFRVLVSASNGSDVTERDEDITRAEPVLSTAQLVAIATQPWWGAKLPAYFTEQGKQLEDYADRSSTATATPTANG